MNNQKILLGSGSISNKQMENKVKANYSKFDQKRKAYEAREADLSDLEELEKNIKKKK